AAEPISVVVVVVATQLMPLGVPMPRPTAAPGSTLVMSTFKPPTCWTLNVCELTPCTRSVPLNVSLIVGATGVGAAGAIGSPQPAVRRDRPRTDARIRVMGLRSYPLCGVGATRPP